MMVKADKLSTMQNREDTAMSNDAAQLMFLRLSLANAYDQQDWPRVQEICDTIDRLAIEKAKRCLKSFEDVI